MRHSIVHNQEDDDDNNNGDMSERRQLPSLSPPNAKPVPVDLVNLDTTVSSNDAMNSDLTAPPSSTSEEDSRTIDLSIIKSLNLENKIINDMGTTKKEGDNLVQQPTFPSALSHQSEVESPNCDHSLQSPPPQVNSSLDDTTERLEQVDLSSSSTSTASTCDAMNQEDENLAMIVHQTDTNTMSAVAPTMSLENQYQLPTESQVRTVSELNGNRPNNNNDVSVTFSPDDETSSNITHSHDNISTNNSDASVTPPPPFETSLEDPISSSPAPAAVSSPPSSCLLRCCLTLFSYALILYFFLLLAVLATWFKLIGVYFSSRNNACDVPLKLYVKLVIVQFVLPCARPCIISCCCSSFGWSERTQLIIYNVAFLIYALLVLILGILCVIVEDDAMCRQTSPRLYRTSSVYVSLCIAEWTTLYFGILLPSCVRDAVHRRNGNTHSVSETYQWLLLLMNLGCFSVLPTSAPPGCIDRLRLIRLEEFPEDYPRECCICMCDFVSGGGERIVATACNHVFHKECCREWLRQARSCPVCRADIPLSLRTANNNNNVNDPTSSPPLSDSQQLVEEANSPNLNHEEEHTQAIQLQQQPSHPLSPSNNNNNNNNNRVDLVDSVVDNDDESNVGIQLELPSGAPLSGSMPTTTERANNILRNEGDAMAALESGRARTRTI